ncbi:MAG: DNA polymerase IV [Erysipelotrichaceae bacterium]|nr:DNA polymerase IV [Erysipelotrichaceae bacterium]
MSKIIVHIDLNAFFVRCEEIKDPTLENKPVAVGHDGRSGIVSTCSYEARKLGVHSGQPMFKARACCPQLIVKPVDFNFYSVLSREFMMFVRTYTKKMEIASVDECYADFTDVLKGVKDPVMFFRKFQAELFKKTKLKCSVGIAPTKFLAKMASDMEKPNGIVIIRKRDIPEKMFGLSIDKMFGIGRKTAPRLKSVGVKTIGDLKRAIDAGNEDIRNIMGKFYFVIEDWLNGKGSDEIEVEQEDVKSIGNSTTFPHDTNDFEEIKQIFETLCKEVSGRAEKEGKLGSTIQIVMKDTFFKTKNKSMTFNPPSNSFDVIFDKTIKLFDKSYDGEPLRLVGVTLQNLIDPHELAVQMTFFDYEEHEKESETKLLINELNRKMQKPMLKRASELEKKKNGNQRRS